MRAIEILKELEDNGKLCTLVQAGAISPTLVSHMHMVYHVDKEVKLGNKRSIAICNTAAVFKVTPNCVSRSVKKLSDR